MFGSRAANRRVTLQRIFGAGTAGVPHLCREPPSWVLSATKATCTFGAEHRNGCERSGGNRLDNLSEHPPVCLVQHELGK